MPLMGNNSNDSFMLTIPKLSKPALSPSLKTLKATISSPTSLSSSSPLFLCYTMSYNKSKSKIATVEQDGPSKIPVFSDGEITPEIVKKWEEGCIDFFENKEINKTKHVCKVLTGLHDPRVCKWISSSHNCIQLLTFPNFMKEF